MIPTHKININSLSFEEAILETSRTGLTKIGHITGESDGNLVLELDTNIFTLDGENVIFRKYYENSNKEMVLLCEATTPILSRTGQTLTIAEPVKNDFFITDFDKDGEPAQKVGFSEPLNLLPEDLYDYSGTTISLEISGETIELSGIKATTRYGNAIEARHYNSGESIDFSSYFIGEGLSNLLGDDYYNLRRCKLSCNDYYYINEDNEVVLWNNVVISKDNAFVNLPIAISETVETNLLQEETVNSVFANDVKGDIIPDIIDMEKIAYIPAFLDVNGNPVELDDIEFNFHFRKRSGEGWTATPADGWNNETIESVSDLLYYLDFTEEDIRNQAEKIKKSGIRLSFYDDDNPISQQLMYYTTVFLDSGELYGKYCNLRRDGDYSISAETRDNNKRADTKICMTNRTVSDRNIHGFYLYFFKAEVNENYPEKTIYMKVDFNHAGYGRSLPFMKPYGGDDGITGVPVEEFFDYNLIKLTLKYLPNKDAYLYIIDSGQEGITINAETRKATITLFEGKLA